MRRSRVLAIVTLFAMLAGGTVTATAEAPANDPFQRTWERTDQPVVTGQAQRTWMWGPDAFTGALTEPYAESPDGQRTVQYFDKSRMEITHPSAVDDGLWYVTNGLLVVEMVEGYVQTGDTARDDSPAPAEVTIAGDPGQRPSYADIDRFGLRAQPARDEGALVTQWVDAQGVRDAGPNELPAFISVTKRVTAPRIDHSIASVFWDFMTSSGAVYEDGEVVTSDLFQNPFYATGYPITEAYWSVLQVGGEYRPILWQCFERRCLTYTLTNPDGWQVEAGNVGQHYYEWRYSGVVAPPDSLMPDALESDTLMYVFTERSGFVLADDVTVDFSAPGTYHSTADLPDARPVIQAGTLVNSYYIHADQVGVNRSVVLTRTITFPGEILGVMLLDETLIASHDILGAPGTAYPAVAGIGYELRGPCPAALQDCVTLTASRRTLVLTATVYDVVDQIRVITRASD
jgi:hypothetical protein